MDVKHIKSLKFVEVSLSFAKQLKTALSVANCLENLEFDDCKVAKQKDMQIFCQEFAKSFIKLKSFRCQNMKFLDLVGDWSTK